MSAFNRDLLKFDKASPSSAHRSSNAGMKRSASRKSRRAVCQIFLRLFKIRLLFSSIIPPSFLPTRTQNLDFYFLPSKTLASFDDFFSHDCTTRIQTFELLEGHKLTQNRSSESSQSRDHEYHSHRQQFIKSSKGTTTFEEESKRNTGQSSLRLLHVKAQRRIRFRSFRP